MKRFAPLQKRARNLLTIINIVLLLALVWLSFRAISQPGIALALIWSMFAFEQILQFSNSVFLMAGSALNIFFALLCGLTVANALRTGKIQKIEVSREFGFCLGLLTLVACSYLWSINPGDTVTYGKKAAPYLGAFVLIAPFCATDQKQLRLAINTTIWLGAIIMLGFALADFGRRTVTLVVDNQDIRTNPLAVASYAGYVGICSLFSVYGRKFSPVVGVKIGIFILCAFVIIKSSTRGQLIALTVVCFVWLPIIAKASLKRSTVIAFIASAIIASVILYTVYQLQESSGRWRFDQIESASDGRFNMAFRLLEYWGNSGVGAWIFGLGSSSSYDIVGFYPHNVPVEILAEEGLLGICLYLGFCFAVLFRAGRLIFSEYLEQDTRVNLGVLLALFCFEGILTLKQGSFLGSSPWLGAGATIGWITIHLKRDSKRNFRNKQNLNYHHSRQYGHGPNFSQFPK